MSRFADRLRTAAPSIIRQISKDMQVAGEAVAKEAQRLLTAGAVSGKKHQPSAPGEPPNNDTGHLKALIETTQPGPLHVQVRSNAGYSAALERGTSKMAARPFMKPALESKRADVEAILATATRRAIRKHFTGI